MNRHVEPELLETLSEDHPDAIQSRRDLRLVNAVMGNRRWIIREVRQHAQPAWRILELGAGDGELGRRLVADNVCVAAALSGLDLVARPAEWPKTARWIQGDLLAQSVLPDAEIVIASLFLHHFTEAQLLLIGAALPPSCRVLIMAEPARRPVHKIQGRIFSTLMRMNHVTKNDMMISIRAGFKGAELATALGLSGWKHRATMTALGAYRFTAAR